MYVLTAKEDAEFGTTDRSAPFGGNPDVPRSESTSKQYELQRGGVAAWAKTGSGQIVAN